MDPLQWYFNLVCFGNTCNVQGPGAPLTYFNRGGGGGGAEVHILYPKNSQLQNLSTQKKNHYVF